MPPARVPQDELAGILAPADDAADRGGPGIREDDRHRAHPKVAIHGSSVGRRAARPDGTSPQLAGPLAAPARAQYPRAHVSSGEPRGERRLLEDLQARLRGAVDGEAPGDGGETLPESSLVTRCAWCARYLLGERWLAVPRSLLPEGVGASHGICPDCVDELRRAGKSH